MSEERTSDKLTLSFSYQSRYDGWAQGDAAGTFVTETFEHMPDHEKAWLLRDLAAAIDRSPNGGIALLARAIAGANEDFSKEHEEHDLGSVVDAAMEYENRVTATAKPTT